MTSSAPRTRRIRCGGAGRARTTATRVLVGAAIAPGVGTLVGAIARKDRTKVYVTVTLATGQMLAAEAKATEESHDRRFVNAVNNAART